MLQIVAVSMLGHPPKKQLDPLIHSGGVCADHSTPTGFAATSPYVMRQRFPAAS